MQKELGLEYDIVFEKPVFNNNLMVTYIISLVKRVGLRESNQIITK
jgi:hypothetical protein